MSKLPDAVMERADKQARDYCTNDPQDYGYTRDLRHFERGYLTAVRTEALPLVEALEFYAKSYEEGGCFIEQDETIDLVKTTAVLHTDITDKNRLWKTKRYRLSGRGQVDHGEKARQALAHFRGGTDEKEK